MTKPTNPHLTDPLLRPFISPTFSPIDYLNTHLPPPPTTPSTKPQQPPLTLSTLASQTQSHISTLSAQQARLSTTLTELTDEILRTSSRLAYEVELLRGEAVSLAETLSPQGDLHETTLKIIPGGLSPKSEDTLPPPPKTEGDTSSTSEPQKTAEDGVPIPQPITVTDPQTNEPSALPRLRTLHHVRSQLQSVIQTFNLALSFPMPPSLLTTTASSLVSIQSPNADPEAESKGQAALAKLKGEVVDLLRAGEMEKARERVQDLRKVCLVWKGTSEERARGKWVDGLEQLVDSAEEERRGGRDSGVGDRRAAVKQEEKRERSTAGRPADGGGGGGFLRRLRDEIYLES